MVGGNPTPPNQSMAMGSMEETIAKTAPNAHQTGSSATTQGRQEGGGRVA